MIRNILNNAVFFNNDKERILKLLDIYLEDKDLYNGMCEENEKNIEYKKHYDNFTSFIFSKYIDIKIKKLEEKEDYRLSNVRGYDLVDLMNKENKKEEEKQLSEELEWLYTDAISSSSLGFHINDRFLTNGDMSWFKNEIKIYINSNHDIYKIARLFWDKCDEENLKCYFKLTALPYQDFGFNRIDKLCIYCSYENFSSYINILNDIKKENPDLIFLSPPLSTAIYDGYIGIGADLNREQISNICYTFSSSYNAIIASLYNEIFNKFMKENNLDRNNKQEVINFVNTDIGFLKLIEIINNYLSDVAKATDNEFFKASVNNVINKKIKYKDKDQKDKNKNI